MNCVLWEPRGATLDSVPVWWWWRGGCWESAVTLERSRGKTSSSHEGGRALTVEKRAQVGFGDSEAGSPAGGRVSTLGYGVRGGREGDQERGRQA